MIGALLFIMLSQAAASPQEPAPSAPKSAESQPVLDLEFDADIHNLLQVLGLKRKIIEGREQSLNDGRAAERLAFPHASSEFETEWERRWKARFSPDEVVDISARVYAKYFTDTEVKQQISFQTSRARHEEKPLAAELQKKIEQVMPAMQREFAAGVASYASKLGCDIGSDIAKEHPDWAGKLSNEGPE